MVKRKKQVFYLIVTSILMALVIIMACVPYIGYIAIIPGSIEITLIHIPILIGIMVLPFAHSLGLGITFGLSSLIVAFLRPTIGNIPFQNPLISLLPRMIFVVITYFIFYGLGWVNKKNKWGAIITYGIVVLFTVLIVILGFYYLAVNKDLPIILFLVLASIVIAVMITFYFFAFKKKDDNYATTPATLILGTLIHTILVLGALVIIKPNILGGETFLDFFVAVMSANGLLEVIMAVFVGMPIITVLKTRFPVLDRKYAFQNEKKDVKKNNDITI